MKLIILMNVQTYDGRTYAYRKGHLFPGTDMEQVVNQLLDHPDMLQNHTGTEYDQDEQTAVVSFKHTNPPDDFHYHYLKDGYRLLYIRHLKPEGTKPCDM